MRVFGPSLVAEGAKPIIFNLVLKKVRHNIFKISALYVFKQPTFSLLEKSEMVNMVPKSVLLIDLGIIGKNYRF